MKEAIGAGIGAGLVALVALGGVGYLAFRNRELFDPTSDKNLAARSVNTLGEAVSGEKGWTLGGWVASWQSDVAKADAEITRPTYVDGVALQLRAGSRTYREGGEPPLVW